MQPSGPPINSLCASYTQAHTHTQQNNKAAVAAVPEEAPTRPGAPPGMYASDYRALARALRAVAEARVALADNQTARVRVYVVVCLRACLPSRPAWPHLLRVRPLSNDGTTTSPPPPPIKLQAIEQLREAVAIEDGLGYMEPPRAHAPARHCLGAALLRAGRAREAAGVFEDDLRRHPNNGWALLGLLRAAEAEAEAGAGGKEGAAAVAEARRRFEAAWADAEVPIESPCPAFARAYVL